ncbi:MAG: HD domain-containing protein [Nanoarchaeota archaeon]|nr:HD domain-containing protein [Nanoarchaeota archaeon]
MERTDQILNFLKEIDKLKFVTREIYLSDSFRKENSAEHSWHLCLALMAFEKEFNDINFLKIYKMALIHDLVEIYAGDVCAFDKKNKPLQQEKEKQAAEKLFNLLPDDINQEFHSLWLEFEDKQTKESRLTHAFDKIQATLQQTLSDGRSLKEWNATHQDVLEHKKECIEFDQTTKKIFDRLFQEIKKINLP